MNKIDQKKRSNKDDKGKTTKELNDELQKAIGLPEVVPAEERLERARKRKRGPR